MSADIGQPIVITIFPDGLDRNTSDWVAVIVPVLIRMR